MSAPSATSTTARRSANPQSSRPQFPASQITKLTTAPRRPITGIPQSAFRNPQFLEIDYTDAGTEPAGTAEPFHYLRDERNCVVALLDDSGTVAESYRYDPYGRAYLWLGEITGAPDRIWTDTAWTESDNDPRPSPLSPSYLGNPFGFTAHRFSAAGLFETPSRAYSPDLGRWLQRDKFEYGDGSNLLAYVSSDPIGLLDPYGMAGISLGDLLAGLADGDISYAGPGSKDTGKSPPTKTIDRAIRNTSLDTGHKWLRDRGFTRKKVPWEGSPKDNPAYKYVYRYPGEKFTVQWHPAHHDGNHWHIKFDSGDDATKLHRLPSRGKRKPDPANNWARRRNAKPKPKGGAMGEGFTSTASAGAAALAGLMAEMGEAANAVADSGQYGKLIESLENGDWKNADRIADEIAMILVERGLGNAAMSWNRAYYRLGRSDSISAPTPPNPAPEGDPQEPGTPRPDDGTPRPDGNPHPGSPGGGGNQPGGQNCPN